MVCRRRIFCTRRTVWSESCARLDSPIISLYSSLRVEYLSLPFPRRDEFIRRLTSPHFSVAVPAPTCLAIPNHLTVVLFCWFSARAAIALQYPSKVQPSVPTSSAFPETRQCLLMPRGKMLSPKYFVRSPRVRTPCPLTPWAVLVKRGPPCCLSRTVGAAVAPRSGCIPSAC